MSRIKTFWGKSESEFVVNMDGKSFNYNQLKEKNLLYDNFVQHGDTSSISGLLTWIQN